MPIYVINSIMFNRTFEFTDVIFFAFMILLLALLIVMVYIIKINLTPEETINTIKTLNEVPKNEEPKKEIAPDEEDAIIDLASLTEKLTNNPNVMSLDEYEKMQEEDAIISYDELVRHHRGTSTEIKYLESNNEYAKQIDVKSLSVSNPIDLKKEELFLQSLIELQNNLK